MSERVRPATATQAAATPAPMKTVALTQVDSPPRLRKETRAEPLGTSKAKTVPAPNARSPTAPNSSQRFKDRPGASIIAATSSQVRPVIPLGGSIMSLET